MAPGGVRATIRIQRQRPTESNVTGNRTIAVQDAYPDDFAHCYGCGRLNTRGHLLRTFREGDEAVSTFTPEPYHIAVPGFVYGGLLASLLDCHGMATAAAAALEAAGHAVGEVPSPRYVTAALHVDFLRPTPLGPPLEVRSSVEEFTERKVRIRAWVSVNGDVTARAAIVAVPMPSSMQPPVG
jgi:acyl-coenzyme A thioesterase PaaI-like protein